jgi:ribulose 1,5-bisphosphate synthetase/thiazole synthase
MIKIYMKKLLTTFVVASVVMFAGCKKDDFTAKLGKCPLVVSTNPTNNATNVPVNQVVTATFNEQMNPETFTTGSFTLQQGTTVISGSLSYNATNYTVSFTPSVPLTSNLTYTGKVAANVKDSFGDELQTDYIWTFSTGATLLPAVISTDPANNATGVVINKTVSATFNMPMDPSTISNSSFILKQGAFIIPGTVSYNGLTASFTPTNNLLPSTIYTATITNGVKNVPGIALQNNYVWTFTTGTLVAPMVISTDPTNNATGVAINKTVTATFSVAMDPSTLTASNFNIRQGANLVTGTISYSGTTLSFVPSGNFATGTTYTATITTGAKNVAGTPMANNYIWTFTTIVVAPTVISTDPMNDATGVVINKTVTATFSVPMNPLTINASTFTVKQGSVTVPGTVSYSGTTASFTPSGNLLQLSVYTATITAGVKNVPGTPMANNYVWNFTTGNLVAPMVISTDPANLATGVALNKTVSASFNMAMNPSTITNSTFTIKQGANLISGTVSYSGTTANFVPSSNFTSGTIYTAIISTGAKNVAGTPLASTYQWTFTTLSPPAPTVISTVPVSNATGIALSSKVTATFSVAMNPSTITSSTFTLQLGTNAVPGTVSYTNTTATFTPTSGLLSGNTYTATVTTGAKNVAGTPLANNYTWNFSTLAPLGPIAPDLKSVARFGIIAGVGVSNDAGFSVINNMDVGIYPGARSSVTGFPPATIKNGAIYAADDVTPSGTAAMLKQAKIDLTNAYLYAAGASSPAPATVSGDQGGKTLAPGIYKTTSTLSIQNGDLTLDAKGDVNAVWIFQIASAFTTVGGSGGNVILSGGAQAKNVYWQVASSATIGDYTSFYGNIMAYTSITMDGYATATGRMLAINAAVVMTSTNIISKP